MLLNGDHRDDAPVGRPRQDHAGQYRVKSRDGDAQQHSFLRADWCATAAEEETPQFVSPEVQTYLAPPTKDTTLAEVEATTSPAWS
jgi:hypothetical protein